MLADPTPDPASPPHPDPGPVDDAGPRHAPAGRPGLDTDVRYPGDPRAEQSRAPRPLAHDPGPAIADALERAHPDTGDLMTQLALEAALDALTRVLRGGVLGAGVPR